MKTIQKWKKIGRIFCATGQTPWMQSHASVPIAENIQNDLFRVYFSTRDAYKRSYTGYVIIDITNPTQILELSTKPVLSPGNIGEFDDSGAMATWLTIYKGQKHLYYVGWNLGVTVPFRNSIGLAIADNKGEFVRYAPGPILDRSIHEPHFCGSCCVLSGDDFLRIWYLSCIRWSLDRGVPKHYYHIKYAESDNGIHWQRSGVVAIDFKNDTEYALSRPSVIQDGNGWRMWYSYRGDTYRIGFAESEDGRSWIRRDEILGINVSINGWDSEMMEYPFVFKHNSNHYMLYNGNGFGQSGFGIAVMENLI